MPRQFQGDTLVDRFHLVIRTKLTYTYQLLRHDGSGVRHVRYGERPDGTSRVVHTRTERTEFTERQKRYHVLPIFDLNGTGRNTLELKPTIPAQCLLGNRQDIDCLTHCREAKGIASQRVKDSFTWHSIELLR